MWRPLLVAVLIAFASLIPASAATVDVMVGQAAPAGESGTDQVYGLGVDLDIGDDWAVATRLQRTDADDANTTAVQLGIERHFTSGAFVPYLVAGGQAAWSDADEQVTVTQAGKGGHCTGSDHCGKSTVSVDVDDGDDTYLSYVGGAGFTLEVANGWGVTGEVTYVAPVNSDASSAFSVVAGLSVQVGK